MTATNTAPAKPRHEVRVILEVIRTMVSNDVFQVSSGLITELLPEVTESALAMSKLAAEADALLKTDEERLALEMILRDTFSRWG